MAEFDRVLCIKPEVFVYRIPARTTNRGYRADEWKLDEPAWTGRMRLIANGDDLTVKLEDKHNGELFAQGKLDGYPGLALEKVLDSSRYFVLRIEDSGRHAFVGVGFADRSDAFDLIVNIQDHFKFLKRNEKEAAAASSPQDAGPKLDLGFKEGQTITINLGDRKPRPAAKKRPTGGAVPGLLPPPPGGVKIPGPPRSTSDSPVPIIPPANDIHTSASQSSANTVAGLDDLLNLDIGSSEPPAAAPSATLAQTQPSADPWGDFASAKPGQQQQQQQQQLQGNNLGGPWVQF